MARHGSDIDRTAEWDELRARYLRSRPDRPVSAARGVHHVALLSSDVERTIRFYQELLEFPLTDLFENRDYAGSTHFFFDIGHGNALAFFDMPGLDLGPYAEVLGGCTTSRPPSSLMCWAPGRSSRRQGVPALSARSLLHWGRFGERLEPISDPRGDVRRPIG